MVTEDVWDLLISTFSYERRRCRKQFEEVCAKTGYKMKDIRYEDGSLKGFVGFWEIQKWVVIEHVVVHSSTLFSEAFMELISHLKRMYDDEFTIIKEIDMACNHPVAEGKELYKTVGFNENPYIYIQPSFHREGINFPQRILSYPSEISYSQFKVLRSLLYHHVYGKMHWC